MAEPKPIALTQVAAGSYTGTQKPVPFVVVGDIPASGVTPTAAPAAATTFADLAAAVTYVNSLRTALIASGVLTA